MYRPSKKPTQQIIVRKQCNISKYVKLDGNTSWKLQKASFSSENSILFQSNVCLNPVLCKSLKAKQMSKLRSTVNKTFTNNVQVSNSEQPEVALKCHNFYSKKLVNANKHFSKQTKKLKFQKSSHKKAKIMPKLCKTTLTAAPFSLEQHHDHDNIANNTPITDDGSFFATNVECSASQKEKVNSADGKLDAQSKSQKIIKDFSALNLQNDKKLLPCLLATNSSIDCASQDSDQILQFADDQYQNNSFDLLSTGKHSSTSCYDNTCVKFVDAEEHISIPPLLESTNKNRPKEEQLFNNGNSPVSRFVKENTDLLSDILYLPPKTKIEFDFTHTSPSQFFVSPSINAMINEVQNDADVMFEAISFPPNLTVEKKQTNLELNSSLPEVPHCRSPTPQCLKSSNSLHSKVIKNVRKAYNKRKKVCYKDKGLVHDFCDEANEIKSNPFFNMGSDEEDILQSSLNELALTTCHLVPLGLSLKMLRLNRSLQGKSQEKREDIVSLYR